MRNNYQLIGTVYFGSKSHSRNPLIFGLFERINMVEQIGSGIGRIRQALEQANLPAPEFKFDSIFSIIFKRDSASRLGVKLGVNEQKVLGILSQSNNTSILEMSQKIGISTTAIENNLTKLKDKNLIKREGSDKTGHWLVI